MTVDEMVERLKNGAVLRIWTAPSIEMCALACRVDTGVSPEFLERKKGTILAPIEDAFIILSAAFAARTRPGSRVMGIAKMVKEQITEEERLELAGVLLEGTGFAVGERFSDE